MYIVDTADYIGFVSLYIPLTRILPVTLFVDMHEVSDY